MQSQLNFVKDTEAHVKAYSIIQPKNMASSSLMMLKLYYGFSFCTYHYQYSGHYSHKQALGGLFKRDKWTVTLGFIKWNQTKYKWWIHCLFSLWFHSSRLLFIQFWGHLVFGDHFKKCSSVALWLQSRLYLRESCNSKLKRRQKIPSTFYGNCPSTLFSRLEKSSSA